MDKWGEIGYLLRCSIMASRAERRLSLQLLKDRCVRREADVRFENKDIYLLIS